MKKVPLNPWLKRDRSARPKTLSTRPPKLEPDLANMIVHGQQAGSKEEWYVAQALEKMGFSFDYQVSVLGGRSRRGGQVLDFVVHTPVKWTVVDVRGTYWHTGHHEDSLSIQRAIKRKGYGLVVAWDTNVPSLEKAFEFLRANLPHG